METVKVLEPRVNIKEDVQKNHVVLYGGLRYTEQVEPADSWGSPSTQPIQAVWNIFPASTQTIVDRYMKIRCYVEITTDADLQIGSNDALRQYPISAITDVLNISINGESVSDNLGDKIHAMLCYGDRSELTKSCSMTPDFPDNYQNYSDYTLFGSAKNPLGGYGECGMSADPRGGFPPSEVVAPNVIRYVVTEPIVISPMYNGHGCQEEGFVNVNQFQISYRWKSDLSKILSHSSTGNPITSVQVRFYQAPEILYTQITPDLTQKIPQLQVLPYIKLQEYLKPAEPIANGQSRQLNSDSIKLSQIPKQMYIFARHARETSNFETSDAFCVLERLEVLWNNQSGLFSQCSTQELFEISRRQGCNLSYQAFSNYRGSVFCCSFGSDIGLLDTEAAGVQGQWTIQVRPTFKNVSGADDNWDFYVVLANEGTYTISENMARVSLGNLTPEVVLASKESDELDYAQLENIQGGKFHLKLKNLVNKVARGVRNVGKVAKQFDVPMAGEISKIAGKVAKGTGSGLVGGRMVGGRLVGGQVMRRGRRRG
jgi:hypothetical protein